MRKWNEKPYHSLDYMLRERFGEKVYKVTLNGGMSCPNRTEKSEHGAVFFAAKEEAVISLLRRPCLSRNRLRARLPYSPGNAPYANISLTFRHTPTHTLPQIIWKKFLRKQFPIPMWWLCLSEPVRTVWERM